MTVVSLMRNVRTTTTGAAHRDSVVLMLASFFSPEWTDCAVLLFSLPMTPFSFLFVCLLASCLQSAERGSTARCWSLCPAVNVPHTAWPGRQEPLLAPVRTASIRSPRTLPIWPAHVRKIALLHLLACFWAYCSCCQCAFALDSYCCSSKMILYDIIDSVYWRKPLPTGLIVTHRTDRTSIPNFTSRCQLAQSLLSWS